MKISVVVASILGLGLAETGIAVSVQDQKPADQLRLSFSDKPQNKAQANYLIHRPQNRRANYEEYVSHPNARMVVDSDSRTYNGYRSRSDVNRTSRYTSKKQSVKKTQGSGDRVAKVDHVSSASFKGLVRAFPAKISPPGVKLFIFSPRSKAWAAYASDGRLVGYGRASGGSNWCADLGRSCRTPSGRYTVNTLGSAGCKSSRYPKPRGGAPMPYCMFFNKNYAIHGSPHVPNYNASHGCVRVKPHAAKWLRYNFITRGTRVVVTSY